MKNIITIDGPSGAGKSTIAKLLAKKLGYKYLDTGALYRVVAWKADDAHIDPDNEEELDRVLENIKITFDDNRILVNGIDVTSQIRNPDIGELSSKVSAKPAVRARLFSIQRELGLQGKAVIEGRDTGTVIFPESENKFFLDASFEQRGKRRHKELKESGKIDDKTTLEDIIEGIKTRDNRDSTRQNAPLKRTDDMLYVDTTDLTLEEVVAKMIGALK
ncbi:MAG: (d)CMP kinase [Nitrospirae bacterium]|nr:(d)CMP kinase [Nitrospirota bacterium]